jgi:hypothetical protein
MLQTINRLPYAFRAALGTFLHAIYPHPQQRGGVWEGRHALYDAMLAYYSSTAFEDLASWWNYRMRRDLYRYTRLIYNPVAEIIDFYGAHVYPGVLTADARKLPNGVRSAIPFAEDTDPEVLTALAQYWDWSNWQTLMRVENRFGALCGEVLVESDDDLETETVRSNVYWPGQIYDLDLDRQGNVRMYEIRYDALDIQTRQTWTFRKRVDGNTIRTYRGGAPARLNDNPPEYDNPYGFVPAVFIKHMDLGGTHGVPAVRNRIGLIDELNSLASHAHDHEHKWFDSPRVFWSKMGLQPLFKNAARRDAKPAPPNPTIVMEEDRVQRGEFENKHEVLMLRGPENGKTETLVSEPHLDKTMLLITSMLEQVERAFPEITYYRELRKMSTVTGPGATTMMGDVDRRLGESAANYDRGNKTHFQHNLAIGGWRLRRGDWTQRTSQQKKFAPFDLDSYDNGDLDLTIMPRPLIPETEQDRSQAMQQRGTALSPIAQDFDAQERIAFVTGYDEKRVTSILQRKAKEDPTNNADNPATDY